MKNEEIRTLREKRIKKANSLIQKSHFDLTLQQQKMMLFLISQIKPGDKDFKTYSFNIREFAMITGIDFNSGGNYALLKQQIQKIADKSVWVKIDGIDTLLRWIEKAKFNEKSGNIEIRLDSDMRPFLLQLKANYCEYDLLFVLGLRSKYALRAYEYFQSVHFDKLKPYKFYISYEELKTRLGAETYNKQDNFARRVLIPAVEEINKYSDKTVSYEKVRKGNAIIGYEFTIQTKDVVSRVETAAAIDRDLNRYIADVVAEE